MLNLQNENDPNAAVESDEGSLTNLQMMQENATIAAMMTQMDMILNELSQVKPSLYDRIKLDAKEVDAEDEKLINKPNLNNS